MGDVLAWVKCAACYGDVPVRSCARVVKVGGVLTWVV